MATIGYPYILPTTANLSFQECIAPPPTHQKFLSDATAFRGRLRTMLKEHKHSDRRDFLNVQKAVEDYIPLVLGLVSGIESSELRLTHDVETTWRCTLSNVALSSKQPRIKQKSIFYEAVFTLLTLGYIYMNRANEYSQGTLATIQVAIGDVSTYKGGYGDGSSMKGSGGSGSSSGTSPNSSVSHGVNHLLRGSSSSTATNSSLSSSSLGAKSSKLFKKSFSKGSGANTIGEFTDFLTDEALAGMDHQLTLAADLYCRAAGIFEYIVQELIPRWNNHESSTSESSRPVDVQSSIVSAHVRLALGEAHACTVRKASIKAAKMAAIKSSTQGGASAPAGSGSKTSYALLAKLSIGIKEEYERAYGLLKSVKDLNEISSEFRAHIKDGKVYYEASAQTLLGMDAYEAQHYGKAIGFMACARTSFTGLSKSSKSALICHYASFENRLANEKHQAFEKINNSVTFETIPSGAELLAIMPSGRELLAAKKYVPARPSYGPGAPGSLSEGAVGSEESVSKLAYALQGAYF